MSAGRSLVVCLGIVLLCATSVGAEPGNNLLEHGAADLVLIVPERLDRLEEYAARELATHLEKVIGIKPRVIRPQADPATVLGGKANVVVLGRVDNNRLLKHLTQADFFKPDRQEQGFSLRIDANPHDTKRDRWLVVLCGADPRGTLYAVRDFCHYYCYRDQDKAVLRRADLAMAPRLKARVVVEAGHNIFTGSNDHPGYKRDCHINYYSQDVVFDGQHYVDWLSEWKVTHMLVAWCNYDAYDGAWKEFVDYAHSRGLKVLRVFVPFRPTHEGPPPEISKVIPGFDNTVGGADCPRDPRVRLWYRDRLVRLLTTQPLVDGVQIESPYADSVYCSCSECKENPVPEAELLNESVRIARNTRPDITIMRTIHRPVPDAQTADKYAQELKELGQNFDWYMNVDRNRADRRRWHEIGPRFMTYLRLYRSALKGVEFPAEVDFLFNDFRMSAERDVVAHAFCYRFYGGRFGSYSVKQDREMMAQYPHRKGPFSLALTAETCFDPFVTGAARARKIQRIYVLTIPDYPRDRALTPAELRATGLPASGRVLPAGPVIEDPAASPPPSRLFSRQYSINEPGYLIGQVCADLDNDGKREIVYSSRGTKMVHLLRASDGAALWSTRIQSDHQSIMAYDLDSDGSYEILFAGSDPGQIYVFDSQTGKVLRQWQTEDWKIGNTPVIIDGDGDGVLDGYFGTRTRFLVRMNMNDLTTIRQRTLGGQCGCHTSALDVDHDGRWDVFAGSGDDHETKGIVYRYDPDSLELVWSCATNDNAASGDMVLADIDGDGQVEILKVVDNYAHDDAHDALYAFDTDGRLLWKIDGNHGEDSPNVTDLDGDGQVEIVGMSHGCEVYCVDGRGSVKWRKDLRPELSDSTHAAMTPVLCDLDGDQELEILAMTNGGFFPGGSGKDGDGILFAMSATGEILDRFNVGGKRYWGKGFVCNVDDDPQLELVVSGSGGLDVIETKGFGPNTEHFQYRRTYQRLNVVTRAYEDTYFIFRGTKNGVENLTDNLVLEKTDGRYRSSGMFVTELLTLPPGYVFDSLHYETVQPDDTLVRVNILDREGQPLLEVVTESQSLQIDESVRLQFLFSSSDGANTPLLDSYRLSFATN